LIINRIKKLTNEMRYFWGKILFLYIKSLSVFILIKF